jgi:hypothetical protein
MQLFAKIVGPLHLLYLYCLFRLRKHADNILYILLPSLTGNVSKKVYMQEHLQACSCLLQDSLHEHLHDPKMVHQDQGTLAVANNSI